MKILIVVLAVALSVSSGFRADASKEDSAYSGFAILDPAAGETLSIDGTSTSQGQVIGKATYTRAGVVRSIPLECVEFEPGSDTHTVIGGDLRASGTTIDPVTGESRTARIRITGTFGRFDAPSKGSAGVSWDVAPRGMCGADDVVTQPVASGQFFFIRPVLDSAE